MFPEKIPDLLILMNTNDAVYDFFTKPVLKFCLSDKNCVQCARYKIKEEGGQPPPELSPEGMNVDLSEVKSRQEHRTQIEG
jgi:hypothetical protein